MGKAAAEGGIREIVEIIMQKHPRCPDSIRLPPRWRRQVWGLSVLLAVAVGVACARTARQPGQEDDWERYHNRTFRVVRVVDGDTLDIAAPDGDRPTTRIRLWGVDTPELARAGRPAMHFATEASAFAKRTLEGRQARVVLSPRRTRGKYGRLLAYLYTGGGETMFNEQLLEEGFAYADLRFEHHYMDRFQAMEKHARRRAIGLWAFITIEKMPAWRQRFEGK